MAAPAGHDDWLADLDAATLLDDAEQFDDQLAAGETLAVVGAPFGGRELVLDYAAERLDATRLSLDSAGEPADAADAILDHLGDGPLVVENCQQLYDRTVGGFEYLDATLRVLSGADGTVVTGWNRYAWSYLEAVRDVEAAVAERFAVQGLSRPDLADLVRSQIASLPSFRTADRDQSLVAARRYPVGWRDLEVPVLVPDREGIRSLFTTAPDAETAVFERLRALADGNPGVAAALWERNHTGDELLPGDIDAPTVDLDRVEAFLLRIVLESEAVDRDLLLARGGERCDRLLGRLDREGIVNDGDLVRLAPAGVPAASEATERWRIT